MSGPSWTDRISARASGAPSTRVMTGGLLWHGASFACLGTLPKHALTPEGLQILWYKISWLMGAVNLTPWCLAYNSTSPITPVRLVLAQHQLITTRRRAGGG